MQKLRAKTRRKFWDAAFILPALILFILFTYLPLLVNISYSLTSWNGMSAEKEFIGLQNFVNIFRDETLFQAVGNTIYFAVVLIVMGLVLQLSSALIIFSKPKGHGLLKLIIYLPAALSPIILSYTWMQFVQYTGYINQLLDVLRLGDYKQNWLLNEDTVKLWLSIIHTLQYVGTGMVFFLTGLNTVPKEIYEAAELDGAKGFRKFWNVTLPLIMPSVTVTLFISITGSMNFYALPFALTGGGPNNASMTLTQQIYMRAFRYNQFGYASALGLLFFFVVAAVTCIQLWITRRKEVEY